MIKFAVMIDVDGDWMYVPENSNAFPNFPKPKLFTTIEQAEVEQSKWNTGIVVEYPFEKIRDMTAEERKRALERQAKNGHR